MEFLSAIYLYAAISGVLIAIYSGIYLFVLNLVIVFGLSVGFCGAGSYGFLNSLLYTFIVLFSNQTSFMCGIAYKYGRRLPGIK